MMAVVSCTGEKLTEWLRKTGIVVEGQLCSRVIIDLTVGNPARVYVEQFGDQKIFEVEPPDLSAAHVARSRVDVTVTE